MTTSPTTFIDFDENREMGFLYGSLQQGLPSIEEALGVSVSTRGNRLILSGEDMALNRARQVIEELRAMNRSGKILNGEEILYAVRAIADRSEESLASFLKHSIAVSPKKKSVSPRTANQIAYIDAIQKQDIVFGIGPAGTGKTYLAMAMAVSALLTRRVSRVVLARPAVEAGEKLGFLPGDLQEKVNPYLRPLYDALFSMVEMDRAHRLIEQGVIEIAPLAFMRGRTLDDSFIILDEAQNTTTEQMKMFLTRLGFNSKTVITGDTTQIDLPSGKLSGLIEAERILTGIEGIKIVYFTQKDVVRHKLVQEIVKAYESHERTKTDKV